MIEREETEMEVSKTVPMKIVTKFTCLRCGTDFELDKIPYTPRCNKPSCYSSRVKKISVEEVPK